MEKFFIWFATHLAGGNWHPNFLEGLTENAFDTSCILLIAISLLVAFNIIQFVASGVNRMHTESLPFYIPLTLVYVFTNILLALAVISLGITIGGFIGLCILVGMYGFIIIVNSLQYWTDEEPVDGMFNFMRFVIDYSKDAGDDRKRKKDLTQKYNYYLNLQYYEHD